ncbi:MAG TPA: ABC transporter ATP-binding protein [Longimicrobiales bacterium]|nr:ABC transporter ATP-binding protein [Longimicrobiales bacterium]
MNEATPLLEVNNLRTYFHTDAGTAKAVDGVSFHVEKGEVLGIVGESGCGKSVTSLSIMQLVPRPPGEILEGSSIRFRGDELVGAGEKRMRQIRGNDIAMIFQEPMTSLNPVFPVGDQIGEALRLHRSMKKQEARERSVELLQLVGIPNPGDRARDYPHQLSGGQRQRVMIAMSLACEPELLIADEPTTALDVTIQAQILDLLAELRSRLGMAVVLITHDLGVVAEVCDRVVVMYAGQVVEHGTVEQIFSDPRHPYTEGLLQAVPRLGARKDKLAVIPGTVPSPLHWPVGCRFHDRCPYGWDKCVNEFPPLLEVASDPTRRARCWLETNPQRRTEIRARGAFGVKVEGAPAPAEIYHRAASAKGEAPPPEGAPPREVPPEQQLPPAENEDLTTQRRPRGEPPAGEGA